MKEGSRERLACMIAVNMYTRLRMDLKLPRQLWIGTDEGRLVARREPLHHIYIAK